MATLLQGLYVLHARLQPSLGSTQTIVSGEGSEAKSGSSPITSSSHTAETSTQDEMGLNALLLPTPRATLRPLLCYTAPEGETTLYTPSPTTLQDEGVGSPDVKSEQTTSSAACDVLNGKEAMQGLLECFTGELLWLQARQLHAKHQHEKFARREAKAQQQITTGSSSIMTAEEGQTRLSWQCLPIAENGLYLQTPTTGYVHHCHRSYQQQQNTKASQQALHSSRALQAHMRHTGALPYMDTISYYAEHAAQPARHDTSNGEGYDYGYAFFLDAAACGLSGQSMDGQTQVTSNSEHNSNVTIAESTRWAQQSEGILLCLTSVSPAFNFLRSLTLELLPVLVRALHEVRHVRQPTAQSIIQEIYGKVFDEWAIWLSQLLDERLSQAVRGLVQASHAIQRRLPGELLGLQLPSYSQQQTGQVNAMQAGSPAQGRLQGSMLHKPLNLLYPYLDTPLAILLASFPYAALRVLHTLLLQEQRVLVLGVSAQHAAACVVATQALLTPLTYCGTLVPYLPAMHATSCGLLDTLLLSITTTVDNVTSTGFVVGTTAELVPHVLLRLNAFISNSNAASRCQPLTPMYIADARTGHVGPVPCETLRAVLQESDESGALHTSPAPSHALRFTCDATRLRKLQDVLTQSSTSICNTTCELALLPHEDKLKATLKKVMKREQRLAFRALIELLARRMRQRAQVLQDVEAGCRVRRARRRALRHRRIQPKTPAGNVSFHANRHTAQLSTPITSSSAAGNAEDETDEILSEALSLEAAEVVSHDGTEWNETMQAVSPHEAIAQVHENTQQGWTGTNNSSEEQGAMGMFSSSLSSSSSSSSSAASSASLSDDEGNERRQQQRVASPSGGLDNKSPHKSLQAADRAQRAAMASAMQRIGQLTEAPVCPIDESATLESMHAALLQYNVQWVIGNYRARLQPNTSTSSYNATRDVVVAGTSMSLSSSSCSLYAGNDAGQKDLQYYLTGPADGVDNNNTYNNSSTLNTSGIATSPPSLQRAMRLVSRSHSYRQFMASVWCAETLGLRGVLRGAFLDTPSNSSSHTSHEPQHKISAACNIYVRHPRMLLLLSAFYGRAMTLFPSYYGDLAGFSLLRTNCGLVQSLTSHNTTTSSSSSSSSAREAMTRVSELLFTLGGEGSNNNSTTTTTVTALSEGGVKYASGKVKTYKGMKGILHKAKKMVKKLGATGKGRHHHGITVRMDGFVQILGNTSAGLQPALAERHVTAVVSIGSIAHRVARSPLHGSPNMTLPAMSSSTPTSPEYLHGTQRVIGSINEAGVVGVTCRVSRLNEILSDSNNNSSNHRDKATVARAPLLLCRPLPLDVVHQFASYHRLLDPRHATIYTQYYNTTTTTSNNDVVVDDKGQVSTLVTSATQREVQREDCAQRGSGESHVRQIMSQATLYRTLGLLCPTCVPMWRRAEQLRLAALLVQEQHQKEAAMVTPSSRPFITKVEDTVFTPTTTTTPKGKETDKKSVEDKHTSTAVKQPAVTSPHTAFFPVSLDELWSQGWPTSPQPITTTTSTTPTQPFVPVAPQDNTEAVVERRESMSPVMQRFTLMPQGEDVSTQQLVPQQHVDVFGSNWGAFTSGVPEGYIAPTEAAGTTQILHNTSLAGGTTSVNTTTWWTPGNNVMTPVMNTTTAGSSNTITSHARPASPHDLLDELFGPSPHA